MKKIIKNLFNLQPKKTLYYLFLIEDRLKKAINSTASSYEEKYFNLNIHPKHRLIKYHKFFTERIHRNEKVLDIGCGYGAVAFSISKRTNNQVIGIDYNIENIEKAKRLYKRKNLKFLLVDATKTEKKIPFDIIILSNVLEHIKNRIGFLQKCNYLFTPKKWLIRVPIKNRDWSIALREEIGQKYFLDDDHKIEYTIQTFKSEITKAGMIIQEIQINWGEIWAEIRTKNN